MSTGQAGSAWWERAFGRHYGAIYAHRDDAQAAQEIAGILPRLRERPGPVLDVGCGAGRHLRHLRAGGLTAVGMDLSPELVACAGRCEALHGCVARADMRAPPFTRGWRAVLLLFTSFGYFDDQANAACLAGLARLLAPGGELVLDVPDAEVIARDLKQRSTRQGPDGEPILERRWWEGRRVLKEVRYRGETWTESVRIYRRDEIVALARDCGLVESARWSSLAGADIPGCRQVHWLRAPNAVH